MNRRSFLKRTAAFVAVPIVGAVFSELVPAVSRVMVSGADLDGEMVLTSEMGTIDLGITWDPMPAPARDLWAGHTAYIQGLIDEAALRGSGYVHLPKGTWHLSAPLQIRSNLVINGEGALLDIAAPYAIRGEAGIENATVIGVCARLSSEYQEKGDEPTSVL